MTQLFAAPADLAALATGGPCLLLHEHANAAGLVLPGLTLWRASPRGEEGLRLHLHDATPPDTVVPLPGLPAGLLAFVASSDDAAAAMRACWGDDTTAPGVIMTGPGMLPAITRLATTALAARTAEAARLHLAVATLRMEAEETREAFSSLLRTTGHDSAVAPALAIATDPGDQRAEAGAEGLVLAQRLGCSLEGVAAIGVHVAAARLSDALVVRLLGAESGRVRAAWAVPAEAVTPGWLQLDLPMPLGALRETAVLELVAAPGDEFALSLEEAEAPPDRCPALLAGSAAPGHALALRVWAAPFGRRFILSPWWDWEAQDLPPAVPLRLPAAAWNGARILAGRGLPLAIGSTDPARPILALNPGEPPALVALPALPLTGFDLLEAEIAVRLGEAGALEAALWAVPAELPFAGMADLDSPAPGVRGTGWRQVDPARGGLSLALRLGAAAGMVMPVLALRHAGAPAGEAAPLQVEWGELTARRFAPALPPAPPRREGPAPGAGFLAAVPEAALPRLEGSEPVRLMELFTMPGGWYRHIDILVEGLRLGALSWPRVRFKFAVNGDAPQIEVRARPDWPVIFERWPGTRADEHGPFLVLTEAERGGKAAAMMRTPRDRRLLEAILALLPTLVATAARAATTDPAEYEDWLGLARKFARTMQEDAEA